MPLSVKNLIAAIRAFLIADPSKSVGILIFVVGAIFTKYDPAGARYTPLVVAAICLLLVIFVIRPNVSKGETVADVIATTLSNLEHLDPGAVQIVEAAVDRNPPHGINKPGDELGGK